MTDLSPQSQAVMDAFLKAPMGQSHVDDDLIAVAAALRAAADQLVLVQWNGRIEPAAPHSLGVNFSRDALHAIATELESHQ